MTRRELQAALELKTMLTISNSDLEIDVDFRINPQGGREELAPRHKAAKKAAEPPDISWRSGGRL